MVPAKWQVSSEKSGKVSESEVLFGFHYKTAMFENSGESTESVSQGSERPKRLAAS